MDPRLRKQRELTDQINIDLLGFLEAPAGYVGDERCHAYWELMYISRGNGTVRYRGSDHHFRETDLLLIEREEKHCVSLSGPDDLEMLYVGFTLKLNPGFRLATEIPANLYPENRTHVVKDMLRNVLEQMKNDNMDSVVTACSILYALAIIIHTIAGDDPERNEKIESVEKARNYLERNIHRPVTIREIASHVNLSDHYCSTLFRETLGITPKQYHTSLRMTLAAEILKNKNNVKNISEVADIMGFSSVHYFSRKFKEHFGKSPSRFRDLERKK